MGEVLESSRSRDRKIALCAYSDDYSAHNNRTKEVSQGIARHVGGSFCQKVVLDCSQRDETNGLDFSENVKNSRNRFWCQREGDDGGFADRRN